MNFIELKKCFKDSGIGDDKSVAFNWPLWECNFNYCVVYFFWNSQTGERCCLNLVRGADLRRLDCGDGFDTLSPGNDPRWMGSFLASFRGDNRGDSMVQVSHCKRELCLIASNKGNAFCVKSRKTLRCAYSTVRWGCRFNQLDYIAYEKITQSPCIHNHGIRFSKLDFEKQGELSWGDILFCMLKNVWTILNGAMTMEVKI